MRKIHAETDLAAKHFATIEGNEYIEEVTGMDDRVHEAIARAQSDAHADSPLAEAS